MITRIVKMKFKSEQVETFLRIFRESAPLIRSFPGCRGVKLMRESGSSSTLFTISQWDSLEHLEQYRSSGLFQSTWAQTKLLFDGKPEAWSIEEIA
ncbi:MAG TPA: antibiotic biosynthesis monooxygenase family protein [Saprospiraceae bacterium]|nr:antibiotic biosynthesis monooxygenase family protein [Saprospiraceae bacterium]